MSFNLSNLLFLIKPTGSGNLLDRATFRATPASASYTTQSGTQVASAFLWPVAETSDLDFTSGAWSVFADFFLTGNPTDYPAILDRTWLTDPTHNGGWGLDMRGSADPTPGYNAYIFNNNAYQLQASSPVTPTAGRHKMIVTSDGTTTILYIDGTAVNTVTGHANPRSALGQTTNLANIVGGSGGTAYVANAAVFGRALTSGEVTTLQSTPTSIASALLTYTFTGPSTGSQGSPSSNFTITPLSYTPCVITPVDAGGGTCTPSTLTFDGTNLTAQTFTVNRASVTTATVSTTNSADLSDPAGVSYQTASAAATSYTANATPTTVAPGGTVTAPVTPNGLFTGTITGTPSGSAAVGLSPVVKTFSNSSTPQNATWTPTVVGTLTLTWTNSGSLSNQSPETITVENLVTYYTTATNVTGTPTFLVYNAGTTTLASSVTAASPVQIGSTLTWTASFTAPIGDYDVSWDNNGTYSPAFAEGQITGSGTFTYFAHIGGATGTPTLAIYNAGSGTSATVTLTGPAEIGSTEVWMASFTAPPGNYISLWDQSGTYTATSAHLTYADSPSGGGGSGVLASPAPTTQSFAVEGTLVMGMYPTLVGRTLTWAPGSVNFGYSGKITATEIIGSYVLIFTSPPMSQAPNTGDNPEVT